MRATARRGRSRGRSRLQTPLQLHSDAMARPRRALMSIICILLLWLPCCLAVDASEALTLMQQAASALAAATLLMRRRSRQRREASDPPTAESRKTGHGTRPDKRPGLPRRPWHEGLDGWRLRTATRQSSYETQFLNEAEHWRNDPQSVLYRDFSRQFRVPFEMFVTLLEETRASQKFPDDKKRKAGAPPAPLCLKVLACLRVCVCVCVCTALHYTALYHCVCVCVCVHCTSLYRIVPLCVCVCECVCVYVCVCVCVYVCTAFHCTALSHCIALHSTAPRHIALHSTALHCAALSCAVLS
jgi:hypothetical protein